MPLTDQAQAFLDAIAEQNPPAWEDLTPEQGRAIFAALADLFGEGPPLARIENLVLPDGTRLRVYSDLDQIESEGIRPPAVIYFHGGGWVLGNLDTHDALCRRFAKASGCTIVSVDYSLAPEARFPKALQECYDATTYVVKHADTIQIDAERIAVAGDSAGGNLAAAVAIKARDEGGPSIKLQVLVYPVIEPNYDTESYQRFADNHGLSQSNMRWFWQQYLGDQEAVPFAAPSRASSLAELPPAHVVTAEYDVLRDEGEAYAQQLAAAGVPVTHRRYEGNLHGFVHFAAMFDDAATATGDIADVFRKHLVNS